MERKDIKDEILGEKTSINKRMQRPSTVNKNSAGKDPQNATDAEVRDTSIPRGTETER